LLLKKSQDVGLLGSHRCQINAPDKEPVVILPDTRGNAVDFAVNLDPISETRNILEGSLNQRSQITITVPARTMNHRSDATSVRRRRCRDSFER
jgi:hypothetical protein